MWGMVAALSLFTPLAVNEARVPGRRRTAFLYSSGAL